MKKLLLDIEICYKCKECTAKCEYFHHYAGELRNELENDGIEKLLAYAAQYVVCRRCEEPFCVNSCPNEALEKNEKGILQRYSMRCTSCKSCSTGCPFGTIYHELLNYKTSACNLCIDNNDESHAPLCATTCEKGAIQFVEVEEAPEKNIYKIKEKIFVHGLPWNKEAKAGVPK